MIILQVLVILGQGGVLGLLDVLLDLGLPGGVHGHLWGHQGGHGHELQVGVTDQLPGQPEERLLKVVVGLGRDVIVLQVLLSVESNLLGLDFAVAHIDLVTDEDDGNGLANARQVLVPFGYVRVRDARADIEHDDAAIATDVVTITETSKFLLTGCVPNIEVHLAVVREEGHRVHLDTKCGNVALLELTC